MKLLRECLRNVNNITELSVLRRDKCKDSLTTDLVNKQNIIKEEKQPIHRVQEDRHRKMLVQQIKKIKRLFYKQQSQLQQPKGKNPSHSNIDNTSSHPNPDSPDISGHSHPITQVTASEKMEKCLKMCVKFI